MKKQHAKPASAALMDRMSSVKTAVGPVVSGMGTTISRFAKKIDAASLVEKLLSNFSTVLLIAAAYLIGVLSTEVRYLKKGVPTAGATPTVQQQPTQTQAPKAVVLTDDQWKKLVDGGVAEIGKKNAPVTMVEYSDFQCPYCSRHYTETYKKLVEKYVNSGKVRIVFRDLPLSFHSNAKIAAIAARCAGKQGKYQAMHDKLFETQKDWSGLSNDDAKKKFGEYAAEFKLNAGNFTSCQADASVAKAVDDDLVYAQTVGADGTPTFYINKEQVVGAVPLTQFEAKIDAMLNTKK